MFVSLEGMDNVGKTTICGILARRLSPDYVVSVVSDPPAVAPWNDLRTTLLGDRRIDNSSRAMIFLAARIDAYFRIIKPLLRRKHGIILADRFSDSWLAYQSVKNRKLFKNLKIAVRFFTSISSSCVDAGMLIVPNKTFLITADVRATTKRGRRKKRTVFDSIPFQREVQGVYLRLAMRSKKRFEIIDSRDRNVEELGNIIEARI